MLDQDLHQINTNNSSFPSNQNNSNNNNNFDYYGSYYENYPNPATSTLCQMEEQRCSPLNLERRSSPLNLTSVGNIQRKRKPTPGQATPLNMGKMSSLITQENYNISQPSSQDFTCNNQVYDYRIPNKLTAFYNQQQQNQLSTGQGQTQQSTPTQNIPAQQLQNQNIHTQNYTKHGHVAQRNNKMMFPVVEQRYNMKHENSQQVYNKQKQVPVSNGENMFQSTGFTKQTNLQITQSTPSQNVNELYFPDLTFQQNNSPQGANIQTMNQTIPYSDIGNTQRKISDTSQVAAPNFSSSGKNISQSIGKSMTNCQHQGKQIQNILHNSQEQEKQISNTNNQIIGYEDQESDDFLFPESYTDLNYSYSDALNFAAEAMNVSPTSKLFTTDTNDDNKQTKTKIVFESTSPEEKQGVVNDLSTSNKIRLFCSNCHAEFGNSSDLTKHMETHTKSQNQTKFSCSLCKVNFIEESQLLSHNKSFHETNRIKQTKKQTIPIYPQIEDKQPMNMTISQLKEVDTNEKTNDSMKYTKNKSQSEILKLKEELAKEPFPYQCVTCAKKFQEKDELIRHLEEHNDIKPFKCDLCNLGFTHLSAKKRHEKAHSNEKPHQCKNCPKAFFRKSDLTQHTKTHSKAKLQNACAACAQMFKSEKKLKEHTCSALQPPSLQLKCEICPSILTTKVSWGVHMWKHTKDSSYILTSETDPWPSSLANKIPKNLREVNPWKVDLDNLQPLNMQAVPS